MKTDFRGIGVTVIGFVVGFLLCYIIIDHAPHPALVPLPETIGPVLGSRRFQPQPTQFVWRARLDKRQARVNGTSDPLLEQIPGRPQRRFLDLIDTRYRPVIDL